MRIQPAPSEAMKIAEQTSMQSKPASDEAESRSILSWCSTGSSSSATHLQDATSSSLHSRHTLSSSTQEPRNADDDTDDSTGGNGDEGEGAGDGNGDDEENHEPNSSSDKKRTKPQKMTARNIQHKSLSILSREKAVGLIDKRAVAATAVQDRGFMARASSERSVSGQIDQSLQLAYGVAVRNEFC